MRADAAQALAPLAGSLAALLFALGLFNAAALGSATIPLSTVYAVAEAFGWELGLDQPFRKAPIFYGLYLGAIGLAALLVLVPGISLVAIMFLSQMVNGILLPIILVFVLILINDRNLMGKYVNGRVFNVITWLTVIGLVVVSVLLVPVTIAQQFSGGTRLS